MSKRAPTARSAPKSRVYQRPGSPRYYVDVRDLGGGREALIPDGETYATTDPEIAASLAARRVDALRRAKALGQELRHLVGVRARVAVGQVARDWLAYKRAQCVGDEHRRGVRGHTSAATLDRYEKALVRLFQVLDQERDALSLTVGDAKTALLALKGLPSRAGTGVGRAAAHARAERLDASRGTAAADVVSADAPTLQPPATLSDSTARQAMVAMKLAYDHAADHGWVPARFNPWEDIGPADRPRQPKVSSTDFLEVYEGHALLEACDRLDHRELPLRVVVAALLLTGGRMNEVLGLELDDIDFDRETVRFRSNAWRPIKTGEERTVRLWPQLARELRAHLALPRSATGLARRLVFVSPATPRPGDPGAERRTRPFGMITSLSRAFAEAHALAVLGVRARYGDAAAARLRAKDVTPRSMRPTYCAARLQTTDEGEAIAPLTVEGEMGHASADMIRRVYGRLGRVRHRSAVVEFVAADPALVRARDA